MIFTWLIFNLWYWVTGRVATSWWDFKVEEALLRWSCLSHFSFWVLELRCLQTILFWNWGWFLHDWNLTSSSNSQTLELMVREIESGRPGIHRRRNITIGYKFLYLLFQPLPVSTHSPRLSHENHQNKHAREATSSSRALPRSTLLFFALHLRLEKYGKPCLNNFILQFYSVLLSPLLCSPSHHTVYILARDCCWVHIFFTVLVVMNL